MRWKRSALSPDEVLATATRIALEDGLNAVNPDRIAARMRVPSGEVERVAPPFDELVAEVFRRAVAAELAGVKRAMLAHPSPLDQLTALLDLLAEPAREVTAMWLEAFSLSRRNGALAAAARAEQEAWVRCFRFTIERGQKAGLCRPEADATTVATHLIAMIDGLSASGLAGVELGQSRRTMLHDVVEHDLGVHLRAD